MLRAVRACLLGGVCERVADELPVAVDRGELREHGLLQALHRQSLAVAAARAVLVAGGAGVVGVAAVASVR
ncbi:MAG TPA: hypothetical protein VHS55_05720 [Solirubrobacteraceae bacterium]|nr:hypothetical protein [Solirubrobacteraceae bacterium]